MAKLLIRGRGVTEVQQVRKTHANVTLAHKGHPFCAETPIFCVEIELLRRNVTLFHGKTNVHVPWKNKHVPWNRVAAQVPRLKTKPFYMKLVNTAVLRGNRHLLPGNLKHAPELHP